MSLRRTRADWPIVFAALLTMLLSTTLLAAGPIYSAGVSVAGLRQLLSETSVEAGNVRVSAGVPPAEVETADQAVTAELERVFGTLSAELARFGTGGSFALPGQGSEVRDLAVPGFAEGLEQHATLVAGEWPANGTAAEAAPPGASVPVAISDAIADALALTVGDQLDLVSRLKPDLVLPVTVGAVFRIDDPGDPFWWSDLHTLEGVTESDQYRTFGPFLMSRANLMERAVTGNVWLSWRLLPDYGGIAIGDIAGLRSRISALPGRLRVTSPAYNPSVETQLPQALEAAERALLVSRAGMLLVMVQLAVLGGYAILLTAGLLIDHRRVETALLRSRGAGPGLVAGMAFLEGLILAVPAVVLGPLGAVVALSLFDRVGPLAQVGLSVPLQVTPDAYLAAGIAGLACVALLALPALVSARSFSAEQRSLSRAETRPLAQRLGIDIALVVLGLVALWQLRLYGAPLTRNLQGTLGPDPLLIAAPALGLLLGAVVATRVLPRLAEGAQHVLARGRGLVGALGSSQLARRPLRYTRSALMLMLAMSIGVFALSFASTWTDSQRSQADHQVGADVRAVPSRSARALPPIALAPAYMSVAGVAAATPVERYQIQLVRSAQATVLAVDARHIPQMVRTRPDQSAEMLAMLLQPLADARPALLANVAVIPEGTTSMTVTLAIDVRQLERRVFDLTTRDEVRQPENPAAFDTGATIRMSLAVRDARGVIHRVTAPPRTAQEARAGIEIPLSGADGALELVSLDPSVGLARDLILVDGSISVAGISSRAAAGTTSVPLDLGAPDTWQMTWLDPRGGALTLQGSAIEGFGARIGGATGNGSPFLLATEGPFNPVTISMQPDSIGTLAMDELPVLVNQSALDATSLGQGQALSVRIAGAERQLNIVGVIDSFPTADAASPLVIADLQTLAMLRLQAAHSTRADAGDEADTRRPDEWWLDLSGDAEIDAAGASLAEEVDRALLARPFTSVSVDTASGRLRTLLSDPVAVGIIGALGIGAVAAGLFALIGIAVAASVSARQRQTEFALLRALGLSRRQLSAWLWLENGSLAVISVLAGTALGAIIAWVVLPTVTLTGDGLQPTPPVVVALPLASIAVLAIVAAVAVAVVVLVIAAALRRVGIGNVLRLGEE